MTRIEFNRRYFDWMYGLVYDRRCDRSSYRKLFMCLDSIEFTYILGMDANRASDGIDLRYRFGHELGYTDTTIRMLTADRPCSVLEMLVALSVRCEESIMADPEKGNRVNQWFWVMIDNLGIGGMDNSRFDEQYVHHVIYIFLNRKYDASGRGGPFFINGIHVDMRTADIWYQAMWYLSSIS